MPEVLVRLDRGGYSVSLQQNNRGAYYAVIEEPETSASALNQWKQRDILQVSDPDNFAYHVGNIRDGHFVVEEQPVAEEPAPVSEAFACAVEGCGREFTTNRGLASHKAQAHP